MLSKFSVKKPFTVFVSVVMVIILGFVSFLNMTPDLLPSIDLPYIVAMTSYPGANPEKIETSVTKPIEKAISTVSGLENMSSISNENYSVIILEFNQDTNMDTAILDINNKINLIKDSLEDGISSTNLMTLNPDMMPVMMLSVSVDGMTIDEVSKYVNEEVLPKFERIEGVASVTGVGLVEKQISISLDKNKIDDLNEKLRNNVISKLDKEQKEIDNAKSEISSSKSTLEEESKTQIEELNIAIDELNSAIRQLEASLALGIGDTDSLNLLKQQKQELESTKLTLSQKLTDASIQLSISESQLESAQKQLDEARNQALDSADITKKITPQSINQILVAENFSMPAGYISDNETEYSIKVGDKFTSINDLKDLVLFSLDDIGDVALKDIADITISNSDIDSYANVNGNAGVMLSFQKTSTSSTTNVCNAINDVVSDLNKNNEKLNILSLMDQGVYIDLIISNVLQNLIYGGILAIIVLLVFLKSIKPTIVIAFSIPISLLFAIVLMYFSGISLNIISLSGLSLGVGMLVDNSIVVIENIYRLRNNGMDKFKSAVYGAKQVSGAISSSTLTTICVFLPIVFTDGLTRQLFTDMGLTIAYSLIASLIVALTLVPCMASNLLSSKDVKKHNLFDKLVNYYEKLLKLCLKYKPIVLCSSIILLILSCFAATKMGTSFIPDMESPQMTATIDISSDLPKKEAQDIVDKAIEQILTIDDVEGIGAMDSSSSMSFGSSSNNPNNMSAYIILRDDKKLSNDEIAKEITKKTQDLDCQISISSSSMDMSSLGGSGINIMVRGDDITKLKEISNDLVDILSNTEGTVNIYDGFGTTNKEQHITINKNEAMKYGLTVAQVYEQISSKLSKETNSTTLTIDSNNYPSIVVNHSKPTLNDLEDLEIEGTKDNESIKVKLKDISSLEMTNTPTSINHNNQARYISITAEIDSNHNIGLVSKDIQAKLDKYNTPDGYSIELTGETESINTALFDLIKMIGLAIVFIYLIMVAQLQSLLSPFIIMFTIPLAFTGGLLALLITNTDLSVISMLGFLVLSGVVVNNGIVFVDYINQLRINGLSKKDAIVEAGRTRIRPILMTALTTILAMSTMAFGVGMGAEMTQGLAIVTIGGLTYATVLTLFVIPSLYDIFHRNKNLKQIIVDEESL